MAQPSVHGRFIWQELTTADTGAAGAFYAKVVGWGTQAFPNPGSSYSVFVAGSGGPVGGLTRLAEDARDPGARPHWVPFIGADNIDATVAAVGRLGGKVLRAATDIDNVGRYAVLADPHGATFGIYKPLQPAASPAKSQPQPGEIAWQELATSDYESAFKFYSELFGWQPLRRVDMGASGTYLVFGRDGVQLGGIYKLSAQMPAPYWLSYIEVANVDATVGPARDAGARVIHGPMDVPGGGRVAQLLDPSGVMFAVHTAPKAAAAAPKAPAVPAKPAPAKVASGAASPTRAVPSAPPRATAAKKTAPAMPVARTAASAKKKVVVKKTATKKAAPKKVTAKKVATRKAAAKKTAGKSAKSKSSRGTARGRRKIARGKAPAAARRRTARGKSAAKSARAKTAVKSAKRPAKKAARRAAGKARRKK